MLNRLFNLAQTYFLAVILMPVMAFTANAQEFDIVDAGELTLGTSDIAIPNTVNKYFGMNVTGYGNSYIKATIGTQSAEKTYNFVTSSTRLYSYLFSNNLAKDVAVDFRRGVYGAVTIEVFNSNQELQDTVTINLDVTHKKSNCQKHPSRKLKKCARVNLDNTSRGNQSKLVRAFVKSIRGPIVLEP